MVTRPTNRSAQRATAPDNARLAEVSMWGLVAIYGTAEIGGIELAGAIAEEDWVEPFGRCLRFGLLLAGAYWVLRRHQIGLGEARRECSSWRSYATGGLLLFTLQGLGIALAWLPLGSPGAVGLSSSTALCRSWQSLTPALLSAVATILAAPLAEELFFRALLFRALRAKWGGTRAALASSLLFGLAHGSGAAVVTVLVGLCYAVLYSRTGSLWLVLAIHTANNCLAVAASYMVCAEGNRLPSVEATRTATPTAIAELYPVVGILGVTSLLVVVVYLRRNWRWLR